MFLLYFALLLVALVLVHEFGHYIVARWMGVKVLSFSIGFGPTVLAWRRGPTEYAIRALPLGGFVRMLGDDPSAPMDPEAASDPQAFQNKPVWRRALIVAAGPAFNVLLPIVILMAGALLFDQRVVSTRLGTVLPGGPAAQAGLRTGDRILEIDGEPVATFRELRRETAARPGRKTRMAYERDGQRLETVVTPAVQRDVRVAELGLVDTVGRIEVMPEAQAAIVAVQPETPAWQAGLRSGDRVLAVAGQKVKRYYELATALDKALAKGEPVALQVAALHLDKPLPTAQLREAFKHEHDSTPHTVTLPPGVPHDMAALGLQPAEHVVGPVELNTPADKAGLLPGDEVLTVDGTSARSFLHLQDVLSKPYDDVRSDPANRGLASAELLQKMKAALARPHALTVRHTIRPQERAHLQAVAEMREKAVTPWEVAVLQQAWTVPRGWVERRVDLALAVSLGKDERPQLSFGANAVQDYEDAEMIANPDLLGHALRQTRDKMAEATQVTVLTVAGLFRGHVPMREVGGPIFMAQLASRTADLGWGYFFELMVWLSINLGVLNLLPIPLVDGGHLLFLAIEGIRRQPVSLRTRQVAAYIGMSFLGLLFVVVMKNDTQRALPELIDWARRVMH